MRRSVICLVQITAVIFSLLFFMRSINAQCVPPPSGMVAWWPLNEASGPTANDIAAGGVNNSGTWMSSPVPVAGKVAGALSFSGSNSVDVPNHSELNFGTGDFSIDLWIKTTNASGTRTILDKRTGSVPNIAGYVLFMVNGYLGSQIGDGAGYNNSISTGFVANGNWHHIAVTVDRNNTSGWLHYVDGSAVGPIANPTGYQGSLTNTAPFVMARNLISPSQTFAGTLDEIELFNRILDTSEIRSIWAADSLGKCEDTCHSTGDANNDGLGLTVPDLSYLTAFINGCGPAPIPLYSCDLNGDGYVNPADLQLYQNYFIYGIGVFTPYGGYPVLCPCDPIPEPVPDTVNIFGLEHTSLGTACLQVAGDTLQVTRLGSTGDDGLSVNLEDTYTAWECEMKDPDADSSLAIGASFELDFYGLVGGEPNQYQGYWRMTKLGVAEWELNADFGADFYTIEAYRGGDLVFQKEHIEAQELGSSRAFVPRIRWPWYWGTGGWNRWVRRHECGRWKAGSELVAERYQYGRYPDSGLFNWESQGVVDLRITDIAIIPENPHGYTIPLSSVSMSARDIDTLSFTSELAGFSYRNAFVTRIGDATVAPVDTTLVVSNIGSSGLDGVEAEADKDDGGWAIVWKNPDPSGALPVGASVGTKFFFATPTKPDSLSMGLSMTKTAANNYDLAVQSIASSYTVQAFNNGSSVFSIAGISATGLGSIVENAKGVFPTTIKGSGTGKPASVIASSDYDFTAATNGVQWTWAAHGVTNLQIDYLSISTEVPGRRLYGVTHATMCGANGAKAEPISFTILDIAVVPSYVCGDANGSGIVNALDITYLINYLYKHGPAPYPLHAGDANGNGTINALDITYLINFLYKHGATPKCP